MMDEPIRVLHVEDVARDAELIWREMKRAGMSFEPVRVEDEQEFLRVLQSLRPDIILSDYSLPRFDGMRALELARQHAPNIPVIMVTGSQNEETAVACMHAGAADYVIKEHLSRLPAAVDSALRHRKVETLRRDAEQRFALFMDFLPAYAYILDEDGRYVFANRKMEELFGTPSSNIIGRTLGDFADPASARAAEQNNALVMATGSAHLFEEALVLNGGEERNYLVSKFPVILDNGSRFLGGTSIDITDRKRSADAVQRREREFRSLAENLPDVVARVDRRHRVLYINRQVKSTITPARDVLLGKSIDELPFPVALRRQWDMALDRMFEAGEVTSLDFTIETHGGLRYFEATLVPETIAGKADTALAVARDVTERQLRSSMIRKLSQAMEHSPAAVVITSPDGTIEYVNRRFTDVSGYTAKEAIGANPRILKSGLTPPEVYRDLWSTILAGGEWRGELLNRRKSGELFWEFASISAIRDDSGRISNFVALQEDITERKRTQEALRDSERQFLQAQKMEAVGRLAGGVAHDFNNILMAILLQGNALLKLAGDNERIRKAVGQILSAGERASALTRQLLAFSRNDPASPLVLSPAAVIHDVRDMLQRVVTEDVRLTFDLDRNSSNVRGDAGQIEQVVMNLVINARDAMPCGGTITIRVHDALPEEAVAAGGVAGVSYVVLSVADTGVGMDDVTMQRIFEPFFTTKPKAKGTGLGLSMVYGVVTGAGGVIGVASEPGRGSTFNIFMPAAECEADTLPAPDDGAAATDLRGTETILLVEDDPLVREVISGTLRANGYSVLEAQDGAEALEIAESAEPIHLLLTDVVMPVLNGVEVARAIAMFSPEVRVLLMSGYADDTLAPYGLDAADAVLLHKPFTERRLLEVVRHSLGRAITAASAASIA